MKVLFIGTGTASDDSCLSGGDVRFIEIAKAWQVKGHEVHLLGSPSSQKLCNRLGLNVVIHDFSGPTGKGRAKAVLLALKAMFFSPSLLGSFVPDIVYSNNDILFDVLPALRLKMKYGRRIKWACVVHWLPPLPWKRKQATLLNSTLFFINERISVWLANFFADILLPVSKSTERSLREAGANKKKINAVECGVSYSAIRSFTENITEKKCEAVFMKRLQAVKGIFDLINIWERVVKHKSDAKLVIIGEGTEEAKAKEMVKEKGLESNIEFVGAIIDPKSKFIKVAESRMFLLPTYEENWAIVVGEAMASGVPVLAYDLKELTEVWGDNFVKIPLGDRDRFARKIIDFLNSSDELGRIRQKGLDFVRKYDWNLVGNKEIKIILKNE